MLVTVRSGLLSAPTLESASVFGGQYGGQYTEQFLLLSARFVAKADSKDGADGFSWDKGRVICKPS